jgi:serine/threonine-protein kinase
VNGQRVAFRHCDVKPSNILVQGGTVKLADFSLAVQTTSPMWYHRKMGTLDYAAPEIFHGWLSDKTDQYALAVSFYQLRTGQLLFKDTPDRFRSDYVRPTPNLSLLTPKEQSILSRALAATPQDRWPTCADMMQRLAKAVVPDKRQQQLGRF